MLFSLICNAQVKLDSIFQVIDTIPNFQRQLWKIESVARKNRLSNKETNKLIEKTNSLTSGKNEIDLLFQIQKTIGNIYHEQNKGNEALTEHFKALKLAEDAKHVFYIGDAHDHIAEDYQLLNNKKFAQKHFYYALSYFEKTDSISYMADVYNLLGTNYKNQDKIDSALKYHEKCLAIRIKTNSQKGIAYSYNNLAVTYIRAKDYEKAEPFLIKSLEIKRRLKDKKGTAGSLINLADIMTYKKDFKEAEKLYDEGRKLALEAKAGAFFRIGTLNLASMYFKMGEYKNSAIYYVRSKEVADSLNDEETNKAIAELTSQYETEKKNSEIALQQEQLKTQEAENTKQKIMIIASGVAILMMIVAIFFVYRSYRQNKRNAKVLQAKNHVIEEKNREITDSINYAKLIQQSLLASKEMLDKNLESYFILYKPKDIVSGDFYWGAESENGFLIACVDCTGHGVPGAFMSLIGKENLDKAVAKTIKPGEILSELNKGVKRSLNQNGTSGNKDGMDAAILRIEKDKNGDGIVSYAGANRPLYILKNEGQTIEEIKATKQAVGGFTSNEQIFEEHSINVKKGDTLFITTDGCADQFGSESNKKLTTKRFKELLVSVKAKNASEQKETLNNFFTTWQGNREQLDDMLVIGINV